MADVTVSIVNTNGRELLLACLQSLADVDADVVVLDNASEDRSADAVRARFPEVQVIEQRHRAGFGANHNAVMRQTSGSYVLILNEDTEVPRGTVEALVAYLRDHPSVAVVGPLVRGFDGRQQGSAWRLPTVPIQLVWALSLGRLGAVVSRGRVPKRVDAVSAAAMLVRREQFEGVGAFDDSYFMFSEEADLAQRLKRAGLEVHYVPNVEVLHHGQSTTAEVPHRQINEVWRSFDLYLHRYHRKSTARAIKALTGLGYALAAHAAQIGNRLPARFRPAIATSWDPDLYRAHVRNAFHGPQAPGLSELAEAWNRSHGVEVGGVSP